MVASRRWKIQSTLANRAKGKRGAAVNKARTNSLILSRALNKDILVACTKIKE